MVAGIHYVLAGIALILSFINLYKSFQSGDEVLGSIIFILLLISVLLSEFYGRSFALKAQYRAIRAEENFRHYVLTDKPLDNSLKIEQIITLHFSPDIEFPTIAQKAVSENLSNNYIEQSDSTFEGM